MNVVFAALSKLASCALSCPIGLGPTVMSLDPTHMNILRAARLLVAAICWPLHAFMFAIAWVIEGRLLFMQLEYFDNSLVGDLNQVSVIPTACERAQSNGPPAKTPNPDRKTSE